MFCKLDVDKIDFSPSVTHDATDQLENGKIVYLPNLKFDLSPIELELISANKLPLSAKNVSYNHLTDQLKGADIDDPAVTAILHDMMLRYNQFATELVSKLFPGYDLEVAKTSYRPIEINGRSTSPRKDDTRLHVDAFPSNPNGGKRILRVFHNINPHGIPRHWRIGERFEDVATKFKSKVPPYFPLFAHMQKALGITKSLRTKYDHTMLHIHNQMKYDMEYQQNAPQNEFNFPTAATWIVYTDIVSHAAMSGCHLLEQTFHLPVESMANPEKSPMMILANLRD